MRSCSRAVVGAAVLGVATHVALSNKAAVIRKWGTLAAVGLGMVTAKSWLGFGGAYASNLLNWFQQASFLTLLGGCAAWGTPHDAPRARRRLPRHRSWPAHRDRRRNPRLGFTMQEKMEIDGGQVTNASWPITRSRASSTFLSRFSARPSTPSSVPDPFGAEGVGENGAFGVSPAIANAIEDAIGVRLTSLRSPPRRGAAGQLRTPQGETDGGYRPHPNPLPHAERDTD